MPMKTAEDFQSQIRSVLRDHGRLKQDVSALRPDDDLYQFGMTSHASVNVMLALEGEFNLEFPDDMLKRSVFCSIASIERALADLNGR
jgi:acyl carrier protein